MRWAAPLLAIATWWPASASAQTEAAPVVLTSAGPQSVAVTLYRDPQRGPNERIDRDSPSGFAVVTETRTVKLPAGTAVIRFEGVAGNILPETALVAGLPEGVGEKNLDASLLSPRTLFDRALGRRVMIRRTDRKTGRIMTEQATIRSSSDGAAVLQIAGGYTDLKCSGYPETLVYDGVPAGLSAKPTLSVRTTSAVARTVTITLSYLAGGFDWQADYIVTMRPDGRSADLFAWITLASSDVTSFVDADTQVVAGEVNRDTDSADRQLGAGDGELRLKCWPLPDYALTPAPSPVSVSGGGMTDDDYSDIVVTARRRAAPVAEMPAALTALSEQLGDLKLYRFPTRVTVASNAQKQVAMLARPGVKLWPVYIADIRDGDADTGLILRGRNTVASGLGVPLPAGRVAVFDRVKGETLLVGESVTADKTLGEEITFRLGVPDQVETKVETLREQGRRTGFRATVINRNPWPIDYEATIRIDDGSVLKARTGRLGRKDGLPLWTVRVPANAQAVLTYDVTASKAADDQ